MTGERLKTFSGKLHLSVEELYQVILCLYVDLQIIGTMFKVQRRFTVQKPERTKEESHTAKVAKFYTNL